MTNLLVKLFIKKEAELPAAQRKAAYGTLAARVGIVANLLLSGTKFAAGFFAGSAALISDAANNLSDILSSLVSLVGFKLAAKPADEKHPFGHGRYEYIVSLAISFLVLIMGVDLLKNGIAKIIHPAPVLASPLLIVILAACVIVKLWLGIFNLSLAKRADITALKAVAKDAFGDCLSTAAVLLSIVLEKLFDWRVDGYVAVAVSLLVIWGGISIFRDSVNPLLGKPAKKETAQELTAFMCGFDARILGVHDLVLHDYGMGRIFAVAHAEVPAQCSLVEIHEVMDALEKAAGERFGIHLVLHTDPVDTQNRQLEQLKKAVETIARSMDEHYSVHDFRLSDDGEEMAFDLVIDSDIQQESEKIAQLLEQRIIAVVGEKPRAKIQVEFSFTER